MKIENIETVNHWFFIMKVSTIGCAEFGKNRTLSLMKRVSKVHNFYHHEIDGVVRDLTQFRADPSMKDYHGIMEYHVEMSVEKEQTELFCWGLAAFVAYLPPGPVLIIGNVFGSWRSVRKCKRLVDEKQ